MAERPRQASDAPPIRWDLVDAYLADPESDPSALHDEGVRYLSCYLPARHLVDWIRSGHGAADVAPPDQAEAFAGVIRRIDGCEGRRRHPTSIPVHPRAYARATVPAPLKHGPFARGSSLQVWGSVTAVAVTFVLLILGVTMPGRESTGRAARSAVTTYVTANGERAKVVLPDSTVVTLNVSSRVDVSRTFGDRDRTVSLRYGEAYFQVAHVAGRPFVVEAAGTRVTVLGTEFGVRAYHPADVRIAVRSGRVAMNNMVLGAGDIASASGARVLTVARHQNLDAALGFTTGRLVLADVPLRDAIPDLDRWYDVDVRLGDRSLGNVFIDAVLLNGSAGDLAEVLRKTLDVRVVRDGRVLTLYPR